MISLFSEEKVVLRENKRKLKKLKKINKQNSRENIKVEGVWEPGEEVEGSNRSNKKSVEENSFESRGGRFYEFDYDEVS